MGNDEIMETFDGGISFDILFEEISGHDFWIEVSILAQGDIAH